MVLGERFLRHRRRRGHLHALARIVEPSLRDRLPHAIQIAGDELQLGVPERRAAAVLERDPAVEVRALVVARDGQHVVGVPGQLAGEVRRLDAMRLRAAVLQRPDERRAAEEIVGQLGEPDVIGVQAGDDLLADAPDRRVVVAEELGLDLFLPRRSVLLHRAHERDVAADVLAQQLVGFEEIVFVVLLEDADARRLGQRSEVHRRRIHGRGDVHELQIELARRQHEAAHVAHERDVRVVDGDGELDLIVEGRHVLSRAVRRRRVGSGPGRANGDCCGDRGYQQISGTHRTAPCLKQDFWGAVLRTTTAEFLAGGLQEGFPARNRTTDENVIVASRCGRRRQSQTAGRRRWSPWPSGHQVRRPTRGRRRRET